MTESRRKTELFVAIETGDLSSVKSLVDFDVLLLAERNKGRGPIMAALESGNKGVADYLATRALNALRRRLIPKENIGIVIHDLGEAHVSHAADDLAKFLRDEDPLVRYQAITALAYHLDSKAHRAEFEQMLFEDNDEFIRATAARGLAAVLADTRDYRAARLLLKKLYDRGEHGSVRLAAYSALQDIWLPEAQAEKEFRRWHVWPMRELLDSMNWDEQLRTVVDRTFVESVQRQVEFVP